MLQVLTGFSPPQSSFPQPFPPAQAIFSGVSVLLAVCAFLRSQHVYFCDIQMYQAVKDVGASYDALVDLLESIECFLRRLDIYTKITPTAAMVEMIVKIMVELLSTLALVTKQVKQKRPSESDLVDYPVDLNAAQ
jgi:hypothetical protein